MRQSLPVALVALALALPAHAEGDAAKGESEFRKCRACHSIVDAEGQAIVKGGKTGPNLFGVIGRAVAGTDFNYGEGIRAAGALGLEWSEEMLVVYLADPGAWLKRMTGDPAANSKMSFKLAKGGGDIAAYLASLAPKGETLDY